MATVLGTAAATVRGTAAGVAAVLRVVVASSVVRRISEDVGEEGCRLPWGNFYGCASLCPQCPAATTDHRTSSDVSVGSEQESAAAARKALSRVRRGGAAWEESMQHAAPLKH